MILTLYVLLTLIYRCLRFVVVIALIIVIVFHTDKNEYKKQNNVVEPFIPKGKLPKGKFTLVD